MRVDWYFEIKELATENVLYGSTADSTWENLGSPPQRMAKDSAYVYFTFVHHEARSYRVVSQPFPRGTLKLLKTTPVTLGVSVPGDDFVIERKEESAEYAFWKKAEPLVIDLFPPTKKSAYRLSHLAHQRYKTVVDSVEVDTPVFLCTMLGNVLAPGEVTNLQMQDVKEMLLFSSEGKRIPLQWNLKENHANEVTLPPRLLPGIYILIASDREARQCIKKVWIK